MIDYETNVRILEIKRGMDEVKECFDRLLMVVKPEEDLWDNSEIIRKWKISERTLANWRSKGLISFVQLNGKIWYTREDREEFLKRNLIHN
jgi:hypothetical protein